MSSPLQISYSKALQIQAAQQEKTSISLAASPHYLQPLDAFVAQNWSNAYICRVASYSLAENGYNQGDRNTGTRRRNKTRTVAGAGKGSLDRTWEYPSVVYRLRIAVVGMAR